MNFFILTHSYCRLNNLISEFYNDNNFKKKNLSNLKFIIIKQKFFYSCNKKFGYL